MLAQGLKLLQLELQSLLDSAHNLDELRLAAQSRAEAVAVKAAAATEKGNLAQAAMLEAANGIFIENAGNSIVKHVLSSNIV